MKAATIEEWKKAVCASYKLTVSDEEYAAKATPRATRRVANYMKYKGYDIELVGTVEAKTIQLLYDFQAFMEVN